MTEEEKQKQASETEDKTEESKPAEELEETEELSTEEESEETVEEETPKAEAEVEEEAAPTAEEEKKIEPEKEKPEEEEVVEERIYTVPLGKAWIMPPRKRSPRAMRMLRSFMIKHMKLEAPKHAEGEEEEEPKNLIISNEVNQRIWRRGVEKPPRKIRVRATVDKEGNVTVHLAEGD